jgi:hypothetical protein
MWTVLIEESLSDLYLVRGLALFVIASAVWMAIGRGKGAGLLLGILAAALLLGFWRWRRGRRNRAGLCDEGIFLYRWKKADGELIPWAWIAGAVISRGGSVVLRDTNGNIQQELPLAFFGSRGRAAKFVLAVHDRLRRRGPLPPWVTTDLPGLGPK